MAEIGERNLDLSELARELKSAYPHLISEIEKLERMYFGIHLEEALMRLANDMQLRASYLGHELLNELAPEAIQANDDI